MAERFHAEFQHLVQFQNEVAGFHPVFGCSYPMALVDNQQFLIYDRPDGTGNYTLMKTVPTPMPIPEGVLAAFPLAAYGGQTAAVVTNTVFDQPDGLVMILHEFVHCYQARTCLQDLREQLIICQEEEKRGHITWEIDHPFPYSDAAFVTAYTDFLQALERSDSEAVMRFRQDLREVLSNRDYEYMVWEEWTEGFARWKENRLREYVNLPRVDIGTILPYNRVTFYVGGAVYIDLLVQRDPELQFDFPALFKAMMAGEV